MIRRERRNENYENNLETLPIPDNFKKRIIINDDNLFYVRLNGYKQAIGECAVFTNKGIILRRGCLLNDGTYIDNDYDLPNINTPNGSIRRFKELFISPLDNLADDFSQSFCSDLCVNDRIKAWTNINKKLDLTSEGQELVLTHNFKIHSIVNLSNFISYGISLNDSNKSRIGKNGIIYLKDSKCLVLVANGKHFKL